jgi:hypothetical protein
MRFKKGSASFGSRLERAIRKYGPRPQGQPGADGTVKGFHEAIRGRVPKGGGASYQTLYRILSNRAQPSESFVEAALEALPQVRREWLLEGTEPMSVTEEVTEGVMAAASEPEEAASDDIARTVEDALASSLPMYRDALPWTRETVRTAVFQLHPAIAPELQPGEHTDPFRDRLLASDWTGTAHKVGSLLAGAVAAAHGLFTLTDGQEDILVTDIAQSLYRLLFVHPSED